MFHFHPKWISVGISLFVMASLHLQGAEANDGVSNELTKMKAHCRNLDSCQSYRTTDDLRVVNCQCGPICRYLGTCCVDSKHRSRDTNQASSRMVATKIYRNTAVVFMVNDCKPDWSGDKGVKDLCEVDIGYAYSKDPFLLMPVTNLKSGITYRNYYCFVCNEDASLGSPVPWELHLFSDGEKKISLGQISDLRFDEASRDYTVGNTADGSYLYYSTVGIPEKLYPYLNWYRQDVISTCAEKWTDEAIREKCGAYTALVYYVKDMFPKIYKNPHCAICNDKMVVDLQCSVPVGDFEAGGPPYGFLLSGIFSFEDKVSRCPRDQVFDAYAKKCRPFRCGRNQKLVQGQCK